ncbi:hypothetical protein NPIL_448791 [Nephila pilipes]|uniref:Uncharacterized protein n=1 Tax=Nephila pilipes TaxID=299642 RepID=A0A8X6PGH8_NEPPI|nr:hypothetical protein NPIL_448791 [Nephila pilipes]
MFAFLRFHSTKAEKLMKSPYTNFRSDMHYIFGNPCGVAPRFHLRSAASPDFHPPIPMHTLNKRAEVFEELEGKYIERLTRTIENA